MKRLLVLMALISGCAGDKPGHLEATGVQDGKAFRYTSSCVLGAEGGQRFAEALDSGHHGFYLTWDPDQVSVPGSYPNGPDVRVGIRHGSGGKVWASSTLGGTVVFQTLTTDQITGTFTDVVHDPGPNSDSSTAHITASGSFDCLRE